MLAAQGAVAAKVPLVGPHIAAAMGKAGQAANQRVLSALASRMVNPEPLDLPVPKPDSRISQTMRRVGASLPGGAGGLLGSRLLGQ